jgi:hypothetical protein
MTKQISSLLHTFFQQRARKKKFAPLCARFRFHSKVHFCHSELALARKMALPKRGHTPIQSSDPFNSLVLEMAIGPNQEF